MWALIGAILVTSLLGSIHCAGMCGAFLAMAVTPDEKQRTPGWTLAAAYNLGRLATYAMLGALAGAVGRAFSVAGDLVGIQRGAAALAGGVMILFGVSAVLRALGVRVPAMPLPAGWKNMVAALYSRAARLGPVARAGAIGLLTTLLPCGFLYMFVVAAAGTGDPLVGALAMAVFWLGTLPVMASLGLGLQKLTGPMRRHLPLATAGLLVAVGLLTLTGRLDRIAPTHLATSSAAEPILCHGPSEPASQAPEARP
jgi:hypothetical protein